MSTTQPSAIREDDLIPHLEDTPLVNAIRRVNGKQQIVQVSWNDLEDWEKREAQARMNDLRCEGEWY